MSVKQLFNNDKAVSPVIGVILMVAITVILAAVIASFVLGMGPDTATTPTATFSSEVDEGTDTFVITMESGNTINGENIEFNYETEGDGSGEGFTNNTAGPGSSEDIDNKPWDQTIGDDEITAGTSATLDFNSDFDDGETYTIRLVYVEGDTTSTLQTFEGSY